MDLPIIIIGAGAAGLMAGGELSAAGLPVIILEASSGPGGRMQTREETGFSDIVESGAEFVHGHLPLTLGLLDKAGLGYSPVKGKMARVIHGDWVDRGMFGDDWDTLMQKMEALKDDISIAAFLDRHFPGDRYADLRTSVKAFAEGYDLADIEKASTLALYQEWQEEGGTEYRVDGGYRKLVHYMEQLFLSHGGQIFYNSPVQHIAWEKGKVVSGTPTGQQFTGSRLIVTASLGVLQQVPVSIVFQPAIPEYIHAAQQLGYGTVIKIVAEFREPLWNEKAKDIGFIISDEAVPTWWTQYPGQRPLLTGWLTAAAMKKFQTLDETARIDICMRSLGAIFGLEAGMISRQLQAIRIYDWENAPYILGGYSYETVNCASARELLQTPLQETIYFAGEALYDGSAPATVEAAFTSGKHVADIIKARL